MHELRATGAKRQGGGESGRAIVAGLLSVALLAVLLVGLLVVVLPDGETGSEAVVSAEEETSSTESPLAATVGATKERHVNVACSERSVEAQVRPAR